MGFNQCTNQFLSYSYILDFGGLAVDIMKSLKPQVSNYIGSHKSEFQAGNTSKYLNTQVAMVTHINQSIFICKNPLGEVQIP